MTENYFMLKRTHTTKINPGSNKVALITGADGYLGQEFTRNLAKSELSQAVNYFVLVGKSLLTTYRTDLAWQAELANLVDSKDQFVAFLLINLDFSKAEAITKLISLMDTLIGPNWQLSWLINNAGLGFKGPLEIQSIAATQTCLAVNILFPTLLINTLLNQQKFTPEKAYILNTASSSAFSPQANFAVYSATKSYLFHLSQALRAEWQARGLNLNCTVACPGPMPSQFLKQAARFTAANSNSAEANAMQKLVWYKQLAMENASQVAKAALKACYKNKAVSYSSPITYVFRLLSKILPSSLFAYLTSRGKA